MDAPLIAVVLNFVNTAFAEYLLGQGFRALMIDGEHGALDDRRIEEIARACDRVGAKLILHLTLDEAAMRHYLDLGAGGFHIAMIGSAEQAARVVRGASSKKGALVAVSIEEPGGIAAISEIAKVPGVDIIHIGQGDLSASMGFPGQPKHPEVMKVVYKAVEQIRGGGKTPGLVATTAPEYREVYDLGVRFMLTPAIRLFATGTTQLLEAART